MVHKTRFLALMLGVMACSAVTAATASAAAYYTGQHGDIGLAYEGSGLDLHYHLGSTAVVDGSPLGGSGQEFAPDEVVTVVSSNVIRSVSGSVSTALGGVTQAYVFGGTGGWSGGPSISTWPYLGFAAEELVPGDWQDDTVYFQVTDVAYSGNATNAWFALLTTNTALSTVGDLFAQYDGSADAMLVSAPQPTGVGGHDHYNWGFSAPGVYEVEIKAYGTHLLDGYQETSGVFTFQVDYSPVPEPSTLLTFVLGMSGLGWLKGRRGRRRRT